METPRHWRLKKQRYALIGSECQVCAAKLFPPRFVCPVCGSAVSVPAGSKNKVEVYPLETVFRPKCDHIEVINRQVPALVENQAP